MCSTPVRMTIADGGGILERLTRMVDLTPDEIPMPQQRLGLLPGCSDKAYSDWLQARGDELGNGVAWRHWTRSQPEERRRPSGGSGRKTTVTRRQLTDAQGRLIAPFLPMGKHGPYPERLRNQFEHAMWRFVAGAQWREISRRVRN